MSADAPKTAATAIDALSNLRAETRRARDASDWSAYLDAAKRQMELLNGSPMSHLEVARAQAHLKDVTAGVTELRAFVAMGQAAELLDTLPDLAPLRETPAFEAIQKQAAANRQSIARSGLAFRLSDHGLLAEDIDYDPGAKRFLITSVLKKKIVTATMQGDVTNFAESPNGWPMFALKIDHARQLVWATEVAMQGFEGIDASMQGRSALVCFELRTGKLVRRIDGPRPSALGDIALMADGTVLASDGEQGGVYRMRAGDDHLERLDAGDFISPQTVAVAADETRVFVPDYVRGLGVLNLATKQVTWLPTQGRYALNGIDGLYRVGNRLIAVQNGTSPGRVAMFSLDANSRSVTAEELIERSTPTLGDPTHGVIVDDTFYYIANSGWDVLDANGKIKAGLTATAPLVMKAELRANDRPR